MTDIQLFDNGDLPGRVPRDSYGGYVYVIEFTAGTVKVGRTNNPRNRITDHHDLAEVHGHGIARYWLSHHHLNYEANEVELIAFGRRNSTGIVRNEYFTGLDYSQVITFAKSLPFEAVTDEAVHRLEADIEARLSGMKSAFKKAWGIPDDALAPTPRTRHGGTNLNEIIAGLFGQRANGTYAVPESLPASPMAEMLPLAEAIAERTGRTVEDILQMSWLDLLEQSIATAVRCEALRLKTYAYRNGLLHLVEPMADRERPEGRCHLEVLDGGAA